MQQPLASRQHILPSSLEIVGVPWVGYIAGLLGVVHQEVQLAGKIAAAEKELIEIEKRLARADERRKSELALKEASDNLAAESAENQSLSKAEEEAKKRAGEIGRAHV